MRGSPSCESYTVDPGDVAEVDAKWTCIVRRGGYHNWFLASGLIWRNVSGENESHGCFRMV